MSAPSRSADATDQPSQHAATSACDVHQASGIPTTGPAAISPPRASGDPNAAGDIASTIQGTAGSASTIAYAVQSTSERAPVRDRWIARRPAAAASTTTPPCSTQLSRLSTATPSALFDELLDARQFVGREPLVLEHVEDEEARRIVEEPRHE